MLTTSIPLVFLYLATMLTIVFTKKDMSIGNFTWGGGVLLITLYTLFAHGAFLARHIIIASLIFVWCMRLALHIYSRYKPGTDPRYIKWEDSWVQKIHQISILGGLVRRSLGEGGTRLLIGASWIFGANLIMMCVMALPSLAVNLSDVPGITILDVLGVVFWCFGFICEAIADHQLFRFMSNENNKGTILQTGLWKYSRHPNYFGEIVMWWSVYLIACNVPFSFFTIITPLTITILLCFVTGIPWIEKVFDNNPEYQEYKKRTSVLIPWWPK